MLVIKPFYIHQVGSFNGLLGGERGFISMQLPHQSKGVLLILLRRMFHPRRVSIYRSQGCWLLGITSARLVNLVHQAYTQFALQAQNSVLVFAIGEIMVINNLVKWLSTPDLSSVGRAEDCSSNKLSSLGRWFESGRSDFVFQLVPVQTAPFYNTFPLFVWVRCKMGMGQTELL